jgi:phosphate:Na+ symporter
MAGADLDWLRVVGGLAGGVCLLNYGLGVMSSGLKAAFGPNLRTAIRLACRNKMASFASGVISTALLSSATATALLAVTFIQSGDMSIAQALPLTLGINVGATLNAHLLAFQIQRYSWWLVCIGIMGRTSFKRRPSVAHTGEAIFGLGLLFVSTSAISDAIAPLRAFKPFLHLLGQLNGAFSAMVVGGIFAILFQNSNTVIAIVALLSQQGFFTLPAAICFTLGANVGTGVTPVLAAAATSTDEGGGTGGDIGDGKRRNNTRDAMRMAVAALVMRAVGAIMLLPFFSSFVSLVEAITSHSDSSSTGGKAVANAHTLFNLFVAALFMPFTDKIAAMASRLMPEQEVMLFPKAARNSGVVSNSSSTLPVHGGGVVGSSNGLVTVAPTLRSGQLYKHKDKRR